MENIVISRKLKFQVKDQRWNGFLHATCIYSYWEGIITIVIVSITTTYLTIDNLMSVDKDDIVGKQGNSFKTWSTHEVPIINHTHRHWHDQHTTGLNDGYQYQLMIIFYIPKKLLLSTQSCLFKHRRSPHKPVLSPVYATWKCFTFSQESLIFWC